MDNWQLLHSYRTLERAGKVQPIECPYCELTFAFARGKDGQPILWCTSCDSKITPGLDLIQQIRAVVNEHYL